MTIIAQPQITFSTFLFALFFILNPYLFISQKFSVPYDYTTQNGHLLLHYFSVLSKQVILSFEFIKLFSSYPIFFFFATQILFHDLTGIQLQLHCMMAYFDVNWLIGIGFDYFTYSFELDYLLFKYRWPSIFSNALANEIFYFQHSKVEGIFCR